MTVSAILLAAGESTRMGQPKPLLEWFGKPLVCWQAESLLQAGADEVVVVLGHRGPEIAQRVSFSTPEIRVVQNNRYREGKTTSLLAGLAAAAPDARAIVILAVDQPRPVWLIREVLQAHLGSEALITSPRFQGHGGHPLIFDASLRDELARVSEEREGIREVVRNHESQMLKLPIDSPLVRLDLNTPEAYDHGKALFEAQGARPSAKHTEPI